MPELDFIAYAVHDHILDKIAIKHGVSVEELDEAFYNSDIRARRTRGRAYRLYSQTDAGRYLLLIGAYSGQGRWWIATARDMTNAERRDFQRR